jgi:hypothetical protein
MKIGVDFGTPNHSKHGGYGFHSSTMCKCCIIQNHYENAILASYNEQYKWKTK